MTALYFKQIELGPLQNFVYLIGSLETREAAVVDPAWNVGKILEAAAQDEMRITQILITHTHFDHVNGVRELMEATDAQVVVHKKEQGPYPVERSSMKEVEGGDTVSVGRITLEFLHTPGHTPGSVCMKMEDRLISGDTLFIGGCGRCDLPGGDPELLHRSLSRLARMDEHLAVYPGHNYAASPSSTIGSERSHNPFLQAAGVEEFFRLVGAVRRRGQGSG